MSLILDADGIIKLHAAGVLSEVVRTFTCIITNEVHHEVVIQGKARMYPDAEAIDEIIGPYSQVVRQSHLQIDMPDAFRLGIGEKSILSYHLRERSGIIVSDDRSFLSMLSRLNIPFQTPASLIVTMSNQSRIQREEAIAALGRIRSVIRDDAYQQALKDLQ